MILGLTPRLSIKFADENRISSWSNFAGKGFGVEKSPRILNLRLGRSQFRNSWWRTQLMRLVVDDEKLWKFSLHCDTGHSKFSMKIAVEDVGFVLLSAVNLLVRRNELLSVQVCWKGFRRWKSTQSLKFCGALYPEHLGEKMLLTTQRVAVRLSCKSAVENRNPLWAKFAGKGGGWRKAIGKLIPTCGFQNFWRKQL